MTTVQVAGPTPLIDLPIGDTAQPVATLGGPIVYLLTDGHAPQR